MPGLTLRIAIGADEKESIVRRVRLRVVGGDGDSGAHRPIDVCRDAGVAGNRRDRIVLLGDGDVDRAAKDLGRMQLAGHDPVHADVARCQLLAGAMRPRFHRNPESTALESQHGDA